MPGAVTNVAAGRSPVPRRSPLGGWLRAIGRQLASVATTLFGLLALTFFMGRMLPIDPVIAIVGEQADQATYTMVRHQLGLDQPLYVQFWIFMRDMLSGHFGNALFTGHPVATDLLRVFPATLELASFAIIIGVGIGVPLGILAAVYRGSPLDHIARLVGLLGYSSPTFWLGLMGLIVFYASLGWSAGRAGSTCSSSTWCNRPPACCWWIR